MFRDIVFGKKKLNVEPNLLNDNMETQNNNNSETKDIQMKKKKNKKLAQLNEVSF